MPSVIAEYDKHGLFDAILSFAVVTFFCVFIPLNLLFSVLLVILDELIYKIFGNRTEIDLGLFIGFLQWAVIIALSYYFVNETDLKQTLGLINQTYIRGIIIRAIVFTVLAKLIYKKKKQNLIKID